MEWGIGTPVVTVSYLECSNCFQQRTEPCMTRVIYYNRSATKNPNAGALPPGVGLLLAPCPLTHPHLSPNLPAICPGPPLSFRLLDLPSKPPQPPACRTGTFLFLSRSDCLSPIIVFFDFISFSSGPATLSTRSPLPSAYPTPKREGGEGEGKTTFLPLL